VQFSPVVLPRPSLRVTKYASFLRWLRFGLRMERAVQALEGFVHHPLDLKQCFHGGASQLASAINDELQPAQAVLAAFAAAADTVFYQLRP